MRRRLLTITLFIAIDLSALVLAFWASFHARFENPWILSHFPASKGIPTPDLYWRLMQSLLPLWLILFAYMGAYRDQVLSAYDEFIRIFRVIILCVLSTTLVAFGYRGAEYSRLVFFIWSILAFAFVFMAREGLQIILGLFFRPKKSRHQVLIIGKGNIVKALKDRERKNPGFHLSYLETMPEDNLFEKKLKDRAYSEVLFIQHSIHPETILKAVAVCEDLNIDCRIVPDLLEMRRGEIIVDGFLGLPTFRLKPLSLFGTNYLLKRSFDLFLCFILLFALSIPLLIIALLIRFDSKGPILYSQKRMGYRGRTFEFYKFRTMVTNADQLLKEIRHLSDRPGPVFKMKNDPRITTVGKWLRQFSLDELPQIFNVLRGDMSFVGPRPQVLWEAAIYDHVAKKRLHVLPGITGLWQVSGRAALSYEEMIGLDIYYLENWSLGLDLKILLKTLPAVFQSDGAY